MSNKEILLLGGAGYVGKALIPHLLQAQHTVHVLARKPVRYSRDTNVRVHTGSLDNDDLLRSILSRCQSIVHLASCSTPGSSAGQPLREAELNILPSLRFLQVLQEFDQIHLIFISSGGTVYGNPTQTPVGENHLLCPLSYHGAGKIALEAFLTAYSSQLKRPVTILRPSNLYGPEQPYRKGFGIIRTLLEHLRTNSPLEIWGDGEITRDFLYIEDFTKACVKVIYAGTPNGFSHTYNVGFGKGYSINQLCEIAEKVTQRKLKRIYRKSRPIDVKSIVLDHNHLKDSLGWTPSVDITEGIALTWKWLNTTDQIATIHLSAQSA